MDEEKVQEEPAEVKPTKDTKEGVQSETTPLIDRANEAAERLEKANAKQEELQLRKEQLAAKAALGGRSDAGKPEEKPKKMSDIEYAQALQKGEVNPFVDEE